MKIVFIDIDEVFIQTKCQYIEDKSDPLYASVWHQVTYDPFATQFFNMLFENNSDLHGVLHSTWRMAYDGSFLKKHFETQGCKFRWHEDWITDPDMERWPSIRDWLSRHPEIGKEDYFIVDDYKPPLDLKSRTIRIDEHIGFTNKTCERIISLMAFKTGRTQNEKLAG